MSYTYFILLLLTDTILAIGIAKYQQKNGYKFLNSFIGALIGLIGFSLLVTKLVIDL